MSSSRPPLPFSGWGGKRFSIDRLKPISTFPNREKGDDTINCSRVKKLLILHDLELCDSTFMLTMFANPIHRPVFGNDKKPGGASDLN